MHSRPCPWRFSSARIYYEKIHIIKPDGGCLKWQILCGVGELFLVQTATIVLYKIMAGVVILLGLTLFVPIVKNWSGEEVFSFIFFGQSCIVVASSIINISRITTLSEKWGKMLHHTTVNFQMYTVSFYI